MLFEVQLPLYNFYSFKGCYRNLVCLVCCCALRHDRQFLPDFFLSPQGSQLIVETILSEFSAQVDRTLLGESVQFTPFEPMVVLLQTVFEHHALLVTPNLTTSLLPDIFIMAYLIPKCYDSSQQQRSVDTGQDLWASWLKKVSSDVKSNVVVALKRKLSDILRSTEGQFA